jgi:hypothetical protein
MARKTNGQVGGDHYKKCGIEPVEYIHANNLDFFRGNIVKYVTRDKDKNGAEDIRKVIDYANMILEFDYGIVPESEEINGDTFEDMIRKQNDLEVRLKKEGLTQRQIDNILDK